jgi:hypothetical protein
VRNVDRYREIEALEPRNRRCIRSRIPQRHAGAVEGIDPSCLAARDFESSASKLRWAEGAKPQEYAPCKRRESRVAERPVRGQHTSGR